MRIFLVGALIGLWVSTAVACEGQKGKVIFEDTFADDGDHSQRPSVLRFGLRGLGLPCLLGHIQRWP